MVKIKQGNILNCNENIIIHQVNIQGIMGGGVARQLAIQYPRLEEEYSEYCKIYNNRNKQQPYYHYQFFRLILAFYIPSYVICCFLKYISGIFLPISIFHNVPPPMI